MSKSAKEKELVKIAGHVWATEVTYRCEECGAWNGVMNSDEYHAPKEVYKDGWRVVRGKLLCKKCLPKRKKK